MVISLVSHSFIKEGDSFIYQGEQDKGILNTYKFELTDKLLTLFHGQE